MTQEVVIETQPTLEILRLSHEGRGVGRDTNGKTVFIDGVLPGEEVTYKIKYSKPRYAEAELVEVIRAAPERVTPGCPHFLICGGCAQQHIAPAAQIQAKQQSMLDQLQHFGQVQPDNILPPLLGPHWGYRTKARMGVRYVIKKDKVLVGFREKNSNYLADIESCKVLHPKIGELIAAFKDFIYGLDGRSQIAQLEVAIGSGRLALVVRNLSALSSDDQAKWQAFAQQHDFDLYFQPGGLETVSKVWPQDQTERLYYSLPQQDLQFEFHPNDFTQVNPAINELMVQQALGLLNLSTADTVLDLFCGLGNFTLPLAKHAGHVVGVEGSETMVQRGYANAARNKITNVEFHAADLSQDQSAATWAQRRYTKVLLDPPRSGAEAVLPLVASLAPEIILYVSCNPATLARDSGILAQQFGYKLTHAGIMDMFPHTLHVESMAIFVKV